jgi:proline racemase
MLQVRVIDSHTGGEPTRVVLEGGPDLGPGPLDRMRARLGAEHDAWRRAVVCEPRGSETLVGALLVPPCRPGCDLGVIFFNHVGTLGMCGHGTLGVVESLRHLGRLGPGRLRLDTPVGEVGAELREDAAAGTCPCGCRAWAWCTGTWPGAATGSSWWRTTGWR